MNCNYLMFFTAAVTQVHASRTRQTCVWPLAKNLKMHAKSAIDRHKINVDDA